MRRTLPTLQPHIQNMTAVVDGWRAAELLAYLSSYECVLVRLRMAAGDLPKARECSTPCPGTGRGDRYRHLQGGNYCDCWPKPTPIQVLGTPDSARLLNSPASRALWCSKCVRQPDIFELIGDQNMPCSPMSSAASRLARTGPSWPRPRSAGLMRRRPRVAVLGGGMAGLSAAWRLSEPGWRDRFESITVYQRGWRLGGKGASSRGPNDRIEEHGLHIWLGSYENAFTLLRECYAELDREHTDPAAPIRDLGRP